MSETPQRNEERSVTTATLDNAAAISHEGSLTDSSCTAPERLSARPVVVKRGLRESSEIVLESGRRGCIRVVLVRVRADYLEAAADRSLLLVDHRTR